MSFLKHDKHPKQICQICISLSLGYLLLEVEFTPPSTPSPILKRPIKFNGLTQDEKGLIQKKTKLDDEIDIANKTPYSEGSVSDRSTSMDDIVWPELNISEWGNQHPPRRMEYVTQLTRSNMWLQLKDEELSYSKQSSPKKGKLVSTEEMTDFSP